MYKILIVDDEPINIMILEELLGERYELITAKSGQACFDQLKTHPDVSLILLDIYMPVMDGYDVAKQLMSHKETKHIPFIFLTAKSDASSIVKGFESGAVDYLVKPFFKEELQARIQTQLKIHTLNKALYESKSFFTSVVAHTSHPIIATNPEGVITIFNRAAEELLGYSASDLIGKETPLLFHDPLEIQACIQEHKLPQESGFGLFKHLALHTDAPKEWSYLTRNGARRFVSLSLSIQKDKNDRIIGYIAICEDITQKKYDDKRLEDYMYLIDTNILTSTTDVQGTITDASQAFCAVAGYTKAELVGKKHNIIKDPYTPHELYEELWGAITQNRVWSGTLRNVAKDGTYFWSQSTIYPLYDLDGKKIGYTAIRQNITDKKRIEALSITDELTGLFNRRHFNDVIAAELNRAKRDNKALGFLMLDVDHFKNYNDLYGHQEGDQVLATIGKILHAHTKRADDFAFRLGGEEFGVLFYEETLDAAKAYAHAIKEAIQARAIAHSGNSAASVVTASMGLFWGRPDRSTTVEMLYKQADDALYAAKHQGRNRVVTHS